MKNMLINQWGETAIAKLQRTAHQVDMQLRQPKELLELLKSDESADISSEFLVNVLDKVEKCEGVSSVNIDWPNPKTSTSSLDKRTLMMERMAHFRVQGFSISSPRFNSKLNSRTVSLVYDLRDGKNSGAGRIEVIISFDSLIDEVLKAAWWKSNKAYLLDDVGNVLVSTVVQGKNRLHESENFGATPGLESDTLKTLKSKNSGVVFGRGSSPEEVSGFYRLMEAPWTLVVLAPGDKIMQPIINFKLLYIFSIIICISVILFVIRITTVQLTSKIKDITIAADELAHGHLGDPLKITSKDEVGGLMHSFNSMSRQLHQRLVMKKEIGVAREVQQNLLPRSGYSDMGISISGVSLYCDEISGDYYDIITFPDDNQKVAAVVGDVVGHGIGAALLMTTVRAFLRSRIVLSDDLTEVITEVNKLLCEDTCESGHFVTLFCLVIDRRRKVFNWVRAGHDPAIIYDLKNEKYTELKGPGLALGVDPEYQYISNELPMSDFGSVVLLGSDGAWEVESPTGETFGKERIKKIIASNITENTDVITNTIIENISEFKAQKPQRDDITLVLVKC